MEFDHPQPVTATAANTELPINRVTLFFIFLLPLFRLEFFFSNTLVGARLPNFDVAAHMLMAITVIGVDSGFRESEAETLAFVI